MRVDFHPAAQTEAEEAQAWYEERSVLLRRVFCAHYQMRFAGRWTHHIVTQSQKLERTA